MPIKHLESVSHFFLLFVEFAREAITPSYQLTCRRGSTFKRFLSTSSLTLAWVLMPPTTFNLSTTVRQRGNLSWPPQADSLFLSPHASRATSELSKNCTSNPSSSFPASPRTSAPDTCSATSSSKRRVATAVLRGASTSRARRRPPRSCSKDEVVWPTGTFGARCCEFSATETSSSSSRRTLHGHRCARSYPISHQESLTLDWLVVAPSFSSYTFNGTRKRMSTPSTDPPIPSYIPAWISSLLPSISPPRNPHSRSLPRKPSLVTSGLPRTNFLISVSWLDSTMRNHSHPPYTSKL